MSSINLTWTPPGPISEAFMGSIARTQIINGPIGSGKTTAAFMKIIDLAAAQQPSSRDGVRKSKFCVVRDTYRQLWKTTLPSWFKRIPKTAGEWTGAENSPARHAVKFRLADQSVVDLVVEFIAIGENAVEDVLRGYEPTGFYLNEADLLSREVYTFAQGRIGRYPDMTEGGPSWYGIIADCNAPELSNWLYQDFFKRTVAGVDLFRQPSGLSAQAENLVNLPPDYYTSQCREAPDWYVERMVKNRPGYSRAGKPIYSEFNDALHVAASDLEPSLGLPIGLGLDAGLHPAAIIGQKMPNGQRRVLDELVGDAGTGAARFGDMLKQLLIDRYRPWLESRDPNAIQGWADPSAAYGVDKEAGEASWIEIVASKIGFQVLAAPTNKLIPRLAAVQRPLGRLIDGQPGLIISPRCEILREGFNSGYRYRKLPTSGDDERYTEEPDKNDYSHPHDCLQYWCSADGEDFEVRMPAHQKAGGRGVRVQKDFDPYADPSTWDGGQSARRLNPEFDVFDQ